MTKKTNTIREQIIEVFRQAGYDMFTACENTDITIREFKRDKTKSRTYYVGNLAFTLEKNKSRPKKI